jgi:phosphate starvation-inducible PhoH-like protein
MSDSSNALSLHFEDNRLLPLLFGEQNEHLRLLEDQLSIRIASRGNHVMLSGGEDENLAQARDLLMQLYGRLKKGQVIEGEEVAALVHALHPRQAGEAGTEAPIGETVLKTFKRTVGAYTASQAAYVKMLMDQELVFGVGPAGTGKTYLAVAVAVNMLMAKRVERIILSRPAVEAGERLGYLPGSFKEKVDPYMRPIYDALLDMLPSDRLQHYVENGTIEIAPLAYMRGRTLSHAYVILDEGQNATPVQMKMFLTRLGHHSRMVVTGDMTQIDLPSNQPSGLKDALEKLQGVEGIGFLNFHEEDIVRHTLVGRIVKAYAAG